MIGSAVRLKNMRGSLKKYFEPLLKKRIEDNRDYLYNIIAFWFLFAGLSLCFAFLRYYFKEVTL